MHAGRRRRPARSWRRCLAWSTKCASKQGDTVAAGDVVLVIDSMKVLHWISAPLAGRVVEIRVEAGKHVEGGTVLAVIEEPRVTDRRAAAQSATLPA